MVQPPTKVYPRSHANHKCARLGFLALELVSSHLILTNVRGLHAPTTAEHAFGLMLALTPWYPRPCPAAVEG